VSINQLASEQASINSSDLNLEADVLVIGGKGRTPAAKNEKSAYYFPTMQSNTNLAKDTQMKVLL
jgi:hypothetical protein